MEKGVVKLVVLNDEDFGYWKNWTRNYLLSQGHAIWEIMQQAYMIPMMLDNTTQGELTRYENNYKALNLSHPVFKPKLNAFLYVCQDQVSHIKWQIVE
jgi:hypothetical protein